MAFETSKAIIRLIEKQISKNYGVQFTNNLEDQNTPLKKAAREINNGFFFPLRLMLIGLDIWLKDFKKFSIILIIISIIFSFFINDIQLELGKSAVNYMILIFIGIAAFVSIYSTPSSYCAYKIDKNYLNIISDLLIENKINKSYKVDLIQKDIEIFESRAKARIKGIKIILAFISTILIFIYKKHYDEIIQMEFNEFKEFLKPSGFMLILFWLTAIYSKTISFVFNTAQIACNEYKISNEKLYD